MPRHTGAVDRVVGVARHVRKHGLWLLVGFVALAVAVSVGALLLDDPEDGWAPTPPKASAGFSAPAAWLRVAEGFGRAFTRTSPGQEAWFFALSSWLTDEQAEMYRDVPVSAIPAGALEGVEVAAPDGRTTRGLVTYDTGLVLEVRLVHVEAAGGWLVATVSPAPSEPH